MSLNDAHYGGNLVDGAKILKLFGDVATELLIRNDDDGGFFRAYDSMEFLAPVHAGDYIEAEGEKVIFFGLISIAIFYSISFLMPKEPHFKIESSIFQYLKVVTQNKNFLKVILMVGIASLAWTQIGSLILLLWK